MPKNKEESDFELNYVSPEKDTYQLYRTSTKPTAPPRRSLENISPVSPRSSGPSPIVNDNYAEPEAYCDPRDQVNMNT